MNVAIHRFAAVSFAVLLGPLSLAAQKPAGNAEIFVLPASTAQECPVSMHAQQQAGGDLLMARDSRSHSFSQRIHLILGDFTNSARIVAAKVTVRGTNGKPRAILAALTRDGSSEATKTLDLKFEVSEKGEVSADLSLAGFTSVSSIRLDSLTFAGGSTWVSFDNKTCRAAPDPLMLVSAR